MLCCSRNFYIAVIAGPRETVALLFVALSDYHNKVVRLVRDDNTMAGFSRWRHLCH